MWRTRRRLNKTKKAAAKAQTSDCGPRTRAGRDDRGSSLVEYAIVVPVLLTFLFGIMDFSRFLYTYHFIAEVAREATRYAVVRGSSFSGTACASTATFACDATSANIQTYVRRSNPAGNQRRLLCRHRHLARVPTDGRLWDLWHRERQQQSRLSGAGGSKLSLQVHAPLPARIGFHMDRVKHFGNGDFAVTHKK